MDNGWRRRAWWWLGMLLWALSACQGEGEPAPTHLLATPSPSRAAAASTSLPTAAASPRPSPTASPTATPPTPPTPTATPTPRPTPTPQPNGVGYTDALHDPIYCLTGKPALYRLEPELDLWYASMVAETDPEQKDRCYFVVTVLLDRPIGPRRLAGGVEFYHPDAPRKQPPSPTWFFDNIAYVSFNFLWLPSLQELRTWPERVFGTQWYKTQTIVGYKGQVDEHGQLILRIPCDAVLPGSTWMVALTGERGTQCDALGLDEEGLPALPLPPTPSP